MSDSHPSLIPGASNDPELDGKYLGHISSDFIKVADTLQEAAYQMRERKISDYPIFPIAKIKVPVGALLIAANEKVELALEYNYSLSMLEEMVQRGIVDVEALDGFKASYLDPDEYCCLLVIDPDFTRFVYIPYPED
jgi:hypothetical protein